MSYDELYAQKKVDEKNDRLGYWDTYKNMVYRYGGWRARYEGWPKLYKEEVQ